MNTADKYANIDNIVTNVTKHDSTHVHNCIVFLKQHIVHRRQGERQHIFYFF